MIFKENLIIKKKAQRTWYFEKKCTETDIWNADNFSVNSDLRGNILSNSKVRERDENGLVKIKIEIIN